MRVITLLSDFGLRDPYVAEMKGVIISLCPKAVMVDITHEVDKYDSRQGAFTLATAAPYFPPGTIHLAIVDPEVGGKRNPLVVRSRRYIYVGPDNGVLMMAAEIDGIRAVYRISSKQFMRQRVSYTFHGRDVFAPTAALIASGAEPWKVGPKIRDYVKLEFSKPTLLHGSAKCEALHVDSFGNVITNLRSGDLHRLRISPDRKLKVTVGRRNFEAPFVRAYSEVWAGRLIAIVGSHDFLELAANEASAAQILGVKRGARITLSGMPLRTRGHIA